jgi:hypothetical protein
VARHGKREREIKPHISRKIIDYYVAFDYGADGQQVVFPSGVVAKTLGLFFARLLHAITTF